MRSRIGGSWLKCVRRTGAHLNNERVGLTAAIVIGMAPSAALAHSESVSIDVTARIKPRCGFAASGPVNASTTADLESAASLRVTVGLDCNTPYALGVTAEKGALVNLDASEDGSGFAFSKVYGASVALETNKGIVRSSKCASRDLVTGGRCDFASSDPGKGLTSGPGITIGGNAVLTIDWPAQSTLPNRLAPGRYKDTLILVVGPRG